MSRILLPTAGTEFIIDTNIEPASELHRLTLQPPKEGKYWGQEWVQTVDMFVHTGGDNYLKVTLRRNDIMALAKKIKEIDEQGWRQFDMPDAPNNLPF